MINVESLMVREIPAGEAEVLFTACGIKPFDEKTGEVVHLPESVRREYWTYKAFRDRIDFSPIPTDMLAMIARLGMANASSTESTPLQGHIDHKKTVIELWNEGAVAVDDKIEFLFSKKKRKGFIKGLTGDGKRVQCVEDGKPEVREIEPADVVLCDLVEV